MVQDGDIICVACGTNLLTGQKIAEEKRESVASRNWMPWILVAAIVAVILVIAAIFALLVLTRDPVQQAVQLSKAGNHIEASNILAKYLAKHPDNARGSFELGKIYWRMSQYPNAAEAFEKAARLDPKSEDAAFLAVASLAAGGASDARPRQTALLRRLTQEQPNSRDAWYLLALQLGAENDAAGQIQALEKVVAMGAADAQTLQTMAIAKALNGDFPGAEQELQRALNADRNADALAAMGFVASAQDKPDAAIENLKAAADAGSTLTNEALTRLGILLISQGRFEEASDFLTRASVADKKNALAQFYYGVALQARGLDAESLTQYEAVAQQTGTLATQAAIHAAAVHITMGNLDQAATLIDRVEKTGAGNDSALFQTVRGRLYMYRGENDRAREAFRRAVALDPNYAPAFLENGLLMVRLQDFSQGLKDLDRYLQLVGDSAKGKQVEQVRTLVQQIRQASGQDASESQISDSSAAERDLA